MLVLSLGFVTQAQPMFTFNSVNSSMTNINNLENQKKLLMQQFKEVLKLLQNNKTNQKLLSLAENLSNVIKNIEEQINIQKQIKTQNQINNLQNLNLNNDDFVDSEYNRFFKGVHKNTQYELEFKKQTDKINKAKVEMFVEKNQLKKIEKPLNNLSTRLANLSMQGFDSSISNSSTSNQKDITKTNDHDLEQIEKKFDKLMIGSSYKRGNFKTIKKIKTKEEIEKELQQKKEQEEFDQLEQELNFGKKPQKKSNKKLSKEDEELKKLEDELNEK